MNLQLLSDAVELDFEATSKKQALEHLAEKISEIYHLDEEKIFDALFAREQLGTTAVGYQAAIPHALTKDASAIDLLFARARTGVDFDASDGNPVRLFFVILAPEHAGVDHIRLLSVIARLLKNQDGYNFLLRETSAVKIYSFLQQIFKEI